MADGVYGTGTYGAGLYGVGETDGSSPDPGGTTTTPAPDGPSNPDWHADDPGISLVGTNGDEIILKLTGEDYGILKGVSGIGIPTKVLTMFEGAADGGTVRNVRTGIREVDLPIGIFGKSRGEVGDRQRRLARALRVRKGQPPARLRFTVESGEVFEVVVYYATGAETVIGSDGTRTYCRWPITLQCPSPFWTSTVEQTFQLGGGGPGGVRSLVSGLARLEFSSSRVIGNLLLENPGDVESDVVWEITGPGGPFVARSSTGESFTFEDILDEGETITVDTATGKVTDQDGRNRYQGLASAPRLFKLPDGPSTVEISLGNATTASTIIGRYRARREVVY